MERVEKSSTFHLVFRCFQLVASQWGRWGGRGCARELTQKQAQDLAAKASAAKAAVEEAQALSRLSRGPRSMQVHPGPPRSTWIWS